MTTTTTTVTPVEDTDPTGDKLSTRLASRRTTRKIKQKHRQTALKESIAHQGELARIMRSGNAVALRLESTRRLVLRVLLPALLAFGAWSTAGVQAGATAMTGAEDGSPMWWALWAMEPALIAIVAVVILVRCRVLGVVEEDSKPKIRALLTVAEYLMWGALLVSLVLNTVGHWPDSWEGAGGLLFHALGPIGAAATVHLIGVLLEALEAVPVPKTEESPAPTQEPVQESPAPTPEEAPELPVVDFSRSPDRAFEIPAGAIRLAVVRCCSEPVRKTAPKSSRSTDDQAKPQIQKSPASDSRKGRADKGTKVPAAAKATPEPVSPRRLTDADLAVLLTERIDSREVDSDPTVKAVQESLSIGFERAKRVLAIHQERTETVLLSVVEDDSQEVAA
ncbi:hypothetical protein [Nocardiopsis sp. NPDC006938]|uniref:hypothetical protein n=1 Tax=Nocardiopsis sp. NPDC006938 TaxID=3364337 RepID=UPI0036C81671